MEKEKKKASDYRYFPGPRPLRPVVATDEDDKRAKRYSPRTSQTQKVERYSNGFGKLRYMMLKLVSSQRVTDFFEDMVRNGTSAKVQ